MTGGMLLANLFLLCWDWHRLEPILFADAVPVSFPSPVEGSPLATRVERAGYVAATVGGMAVLLWSRRSMPRVVAFLGLCLGLVGGALSLVSLVMHWRGRRPRVDLAPAP